MDEKKPVIRRAGQLAAQQRAIVPKPPKLADEISLATQLKEYTEAVGLPIQATPAIAKAYKVRQSLMALVEQQANLPIEDRRSLITSAGGRLLNDKSLATVDKFCINNAIPYNLVAWIENGPYPLTDARYYHVVMDPRGLKNIIFRESKLQIDGPSPIAIYDCRIEFWDDSYVDWETGACSLSEIRANPTIHGMVTRAKTRAFNRAANRCIVFIGAVPPVDEGYSEAVPDSNSLLVQQQPTQVVVIQAPAPTETNGVPDSFGKLASEAYQRWSLTRAQIADIMGTSSSGLASMKREDIWNKLLERDQKTN